MAGTVWSQFTAYVFTFFLKVYLHSFLEKNIICVLGLYHFRFKTDLGIDGFPQKGVSPLDGQKKKYIHANIEIPQICLDPTVY